MQWWGNFGSAVAGAAALLIAIGALAGAIRHGPGLVRDRRAADQARKKAAGEQAETLRAKRRRGLNGWSVTGINTYKVTLVTSEAERDAALKAVRNSGPSEYVILRVLDGPGSVESLRQLLLEDPYVARRPTPGECEALKVGLQAMGIPLAAYETVEFKAGTGPATPR